MRKILILLVAILAIIFSYRFFISDLLKFGTIREPKEYRDFLRFNSGIPIRFVNSYGADNGSSFAVYSINEDLGLLIFKKKIADSISGIPEINFVSKSLGDNTPMNIGSIFTNELNFSFVKDSIISEVYIYLENFSPNFIQEKNESLVHLRFPMVDKSGITFSENGQLQISGSNNISIDNEINEIFILRKESHLYFFYLKPYQQSLKKAIPIKNIINHKI